MNKFNPKKLLNAKWTAQKVVQKERHFIITELIWNDTETQVVGCILEAVINKNQYQISPESLKNSDDWLMGWK